MPKIHTDWKILPHDPIEKLARNLWRVEGLLPDIGMKRVMTIARLASGNLVIHNGMALDDASMTDIEEWGTPAFLIVPNGYHRLDAPAYRARYSDIRVFCPSGSRARVEKVVAVDGVYEDFPEDSHVTLEYVEGIARAEGVMLVRSDDGATLVINDMIFNMPHQKGFTGFVFRRITQSSGGPQISRIFRWFVMKDRKALARELERLADIPQLERIIVSHHQVIDQDPAGTLRRVADALL